MSDNRQIHTQLRIPHDSTSEIPAYSPAAVRANSHHPQYSFFAMDMGDPSKCGLEDLYQLMREMRRQE